MTPYSLFILDIVNAWCVTIINLVLVIFVSSSSKLQNLVTLASSNGASTSSSTQIGDGLDKKTAKVQRVESTKSVVDKEISKIQEEEKQRLKEEDGELWVEE